MRDFQVGEEIFYCGKGPEPEYKARGRVVSEVIITPRGRSFKCVINHKEYVLSEDDIVQIVIPTKNIFTGETEVIPPREQNYETPPIENAINREINSLPSVIDNLTHTSLTIVFNKDKFITYAQSIANKFKGLMLTDDNETEIKTITAQLAKAEKELNSERIRVEKLISEPIRNLKADVDEVIKIFADTRNALKVQLDEAAQAERNKKREQVQSILDALLNDCNLPGKYTANIKLKDEYLNKTYSMKKIKEDINAEIAQQQEYYQNEIAAQQAEIQANKAREVTFNALKTAFPNVNVTLADLTHIPIEEFGEYFAARNVAPPPSFDVPTAPSFDVPVPTQVAESTVMQAEEIQQDTPNLKDVYGVVAPIHTINLRITSQDEMQGLEFALKVTEEATQLGMHVELV